MTYYYFSISVIVNQNAYAPTFSGNNCMCGNKKDVGVCSSAPIPVFRPSHCPHIKDKQRKPAHAE